MSSDAPLKLLSEVQVGDLTLRNRIALAPLTRGRASPEHVPTEVMIEYYKQRSSCGLVIVEATGISRQGMSWYCGPGIWNKTQVEAWKPIVAGMHEKNATAALQLWHMGRQSHSDVTGQQIVAPSAIALEGEITAVAGEKKPHQTPKALTVEEIKAIQEDYRLAAVNAKAAGFDMVEIHSANGYLLDTFLQSSTNTRTDEYGGSVENRLRMLKEVLSAVATVFPLNRIGVRLAPNGKFGSMGSADNHEQFTAAIDFLGNQKVAYVHVMDGLTFGFHDLCAVFTLRNARDILEKTAGAGGVTKLMGNVGYTRDTAEERLQADDTDMIAFGRPYISTPDLPERFAANAPLNPDGEMKYWWTHGMGARGYTDFPTLAEVEQKKLQEAEDSAAPSSS